MKSIDEVFLLVSALSKERKQLFYFKLGFNLTISVRSFAHDTRYDDHERLEGLKNINELSHRNFNWLWKCLYSNDADLDDQFMLETVKGYCRIHTKSAGEIAAAVRASFDHVTSV